MPKETNKFKMQLKGQNKKVDLKIANKKYAITFQRANTLNAAILDPSILGINDKNEIRIMVNVHDENVGEIVEQIKQTFQHYISEIAKGELETKVFKDVVCQVEDEDMLNESLVSLRIEKDKLCIMDEEKVDIPFHMISDIYIEKRSDLSQSTHDTKNHTMKYALQFENWVILECEHHIYGFFSNEVEKLFMVLSQAYFMAQMKQK